MKAKKIVAGIIIVAAAPVLLDCAIDPNADRGVVRSWFYGAAVIGGVAALQWAASEVGMSPDQGKELAAGALPEATCRA